jgi:hypothetical protein
MFSLEFVEKLFLRFCGQCVRNFKKQSLKVSLNGKISLTDIQLNIDIFKDIFYPLIPKHIFLGSIIIEYPLTPNGAISLHVSDVFILMQRSEEVIDENNIERFQKILQTWITIFFLTVSRRANNNTSTSFDMSQMESVVKRLNNATLTITSAHIRIENHLFKSHLNYGNNSTCKSIGIILEKINISGPSSSDIASDTTDFWLKDNNEYKLKIQKLINLTKLSIYYDTQKKYSNVSSEELTLDFIKALHMEYVNLKGEENVILAPVDSVVSLVIGNKDKTTMRISPLRLKVDIDPVKISLTDSQVSFLWHLIYHLHTRSLTLQRKCAFATARSFKDTSLRAKYRWKILAEFVRADICRAASRLSDIVLGNPLGNMPITSSMRWRSWFVQWRKAAR